MSLDLWTIRQLSESPDPLRDFRFSSPAQRRVAEAVAAGTEVYWSAGNGSGKTTLGAAISIALARGLPELGGVALPRLKQPVTGLLIVPSLRQAAGSSVMIYRRLLGTHSYQEGRASGLQDLVTTFWIKPDGSRSNDYHDWSRIMIFSRDGEVPEGIRADFAHGDEPPSQPTWDAVRYRAKPGRPYLKYILATPLRAIEWRWLMRPQEFGNCLDHEENGRLRIQSSIYDCKRSAANPWGHLIASDIERAELSAASSPYGASRLSGQHLEPGEACPFPSEQLERIQARCRPPEEKRYVVQTETDQPGGRHRTEVAVNLNVWADYDEREQYLLILDPSSGVVGHDPAGLLVFGRRRRAVVATYTGHLHPWGLGSLAAAVGRDYGGGTADVELTGGWGIACLSALREAGYHRLMRERVMERPGVMSERVGFQTTTETRPRYIAALQRALARDDVGIWSLQLVQTLADCVMDERGKIAAGPDSEDELLIMAGRAIYVCDTMPVAPYREPERAESFRQAMARSIGQDPRRRPWKLPEAWGD